MTRPDAQQPTAASPAFDALRAAHADIRRYHDRITFLGELMADQNAALNAKIDELQQTVDDTQQRVTDHETAAQQNADAQAAVIADLKAQLAAAQSAGTDGLTSQQVTDAIARLAVVEDDLRTTAGGTPSAGGSTVDTGTTQPGETPVPVDPNAPPPE